jgi:hypothetical protein
VSRRGRGGNIEASTNFHVEVTRGVVFSHTGTKCGESREQRLRCPHSRSHSAQLESDSSHAWSSIGPDLSAFGASLTVRTVHSARLDTNALIPSDMVRYLPQVRHDTVNPRGMIFFYFRLLLLDPIVSSQTSSCCARRRYLWAGGRFTQLARCVMAPLQLSATGSGGRPARAWGTREQPGSSRRSRPSAPDSSVWGFRPVWYGLLPIGARQGKMSGPTHPLSPG